MSMHAFHFNSFVSIVSCCLVFLLFLFRNELQFFWFFFLKKDSIKPDFAKILVKYNYVSIKFIYIESSKHS